MLTTWDCWLTCRWIFMDPLISYEIRYHQRVDVTKEKGVSVCVFCELLVYMCVCVCSVAACTRLWHMFYFGGHVWKMTLAKEEVTFMGCICQRAGSRLFFKGVIVGNRVEDWSLTFYQMPKITYDLSHVRHSNYAIKPERKFWLFCVFINSLLSGRIVLSPTHKFLHTESSEFILKWSFLLPSVVASREMTSGVLANTSRMQKRLEVLPQILLWNTFHRSRQIYRVTELFMKLIDAVKCGLTISNVIFILVHSKHWSEFMRPVLTIGYTM